MDSNINGIQTSNSNNPVINNQATNKPECSFCKQVRELVKGGFGMLRINK